MTTSRGVDLCVECVKSIIGEIVTGNEFPPWIAAVCRRSHEHLIGSRGSRRQVRVYQLCFRIHIPDLEP